MTSHAAPGWVLPGRTAPKPREAATTHRPGPAPPVLGRRATLLGLAGLSAAAAPSRTTTLLVAGPSGGRLEGWAGLLAPSLARTGATLERRLLGGVDGVTGANGFDALGPPDGTTALLVPGAAPLAWLTGDRRAKFDPSQWVAIWAAAAPAVLLTRAPLAPGQPLRVPAVSASGPALPMLLALDLLGVPTALLPPATAESLGDVDGIVLSGPGTPRTAAFLAAAGFHPALALGMPDGAGWAADPAFPGVPTAIRQVAARSPPPTLLAAFRATAAAVQMEAALVLPGLSVPEQVASWQQACNGLASSPDALTVAAADDIRPGDARMAVALMAAIAAGGPAIPALQDWLARRGP